MKKHDKAVIQGISKVMERYNKKEDDKQHEDDHIEIIDISNKSKKNAEEKSDNKDNKLPQNNALDSEQYGNKDNNADNAIIKSEKNNIAVVDRNLLAPHIKHDNIDLSPEEDLKLSIRPAIKFGAIILFICFSFFILWGGFAPLDNAAIAPGHIVLSGNNKSIQHLEGGIIREIMVSDGDTVQKGQILLKLEDHQAKVNLLSLKEQLYAYQAIEDRLIAERDNEDEIKFDTNVLMYDDPEVQKVIKTQRFLFNTRSLAIKGKVEVMQQRILQKKEEVSGLRSQLNAIKSQIKLVNVDLINMEKLLKQGLERRSNVLNYKRTIEELFGKQGQVQAAISAANEVIAETKLEIMNIQNDFQRNIAEELKETQVKVYDLKERIFAAQDVLDRTEIRAPNDGIAMNLQFHTIGGIIPHSSKILDIIPQNDKLLIEVKVRTQDIDSIYVGLIAKIQLGAYKSRLMPRINGKIVYVSADKVTDDRAGVVNPAEPRDFYIARIEVPDEEIQSVNLNIKLQPGMPATAFLVKGERTFLEYIISPITDSLHKAFKEA